LPELIAPGLGEFHYRVEDLITFPEGLPAFDDLRQFLVLQREGLQPFVFLVSAERPAVRFVCLPVAELRPDYCFELTASDCAWLAPVGVYSPRSKDLLIFVILTLPEQGPATVNLLAPVLVNPARRLGAQIILTGNAYSHAAPLWPPGLEQVVC
jgi:flagellar assembly factor FliW